jgi:hypothetical protein
MISYMSPAAPERKKHRYIKGSLCNGLLFKALSGGVGTASIFLLCVLYFSNIAFYGICFSDLQTGAGKLPSK